MNLGCRVISVGNLQAGGAGKTPLVAQIVREACGRGLKTCILIRGYGGLWEHSGGVLLPGQRGTVSETGDEASLLRELCPQATIGIGKNRVQQYAQVKKLVGPMDLVVLDDGFQNFSIHKDLEILALTSAQPYERLFREFPTAVEAADLIVWTKGEVPPHFGQKPNIRVSYRLESPKQSGQKFYLVTGVADPAHVLSLAKSSGYEVKREVHLRDHTQYRREWVEQLLAEAKGEGLRVATTGKDWVKWRELGIQDSAVQVLEPELQWLAGQELWEEYLWTKSS